jgi:hypothetical protein
MNAATRKTGKGRQAKAGASPMAPSRDADRGTAFSIVDRPDGYYWIGPDERHEFGPFETYELALAHRDAESEESIAPGEALHEAEQEIGVAEWLDAETGEPAEGESPPHLQE